MYAITPSFSKDSWDQACQACTANALVAKNSLSPALSCSVYLRLYLNFQGDNEEQEKLLKKSCTLYVGNLSFYTTEEQIYELFSKSGDIKKIIMGLDKMKKTAFGFCGILFKSRCGDYNEVHKRNSSE